MSILGLKEIGIHDPRGEDGHNLIVFVEMDRCATDAIQSVTGCSLGHRTMKFVDYGKMAATFMNLRTGKTVRIIAKEEAKENSKEYYLHIGDKYKAQFEAYKVMSDEELFHVMDVNVSIPVEDMPGRPLGMARCSKCGEYVQDKREVYLHGVELCRPCAYGGYYRTNGGRQHKGILKKEANGACTFCIHAGNGAKIKAEVLL